MPKTPKMQSCGVGQCLTPCPACDTLTRVDSIRLALDHLELHTGQSLSLQRSDVDDRLYGMTDSGVHSASITVDLYILSVCHACGASFGKQTECCVVSKGDLPTPRKRN